MAELAKIRLNNIDYDLKAKELGVLFYKESETASAEGYYKIATITHKSWSYCSFTMFATNSYSGTKFNTLFDVRCSDNANTLNEFAFNIVFEINSPL